MTKRLTIRDVLAKSEAWLAEKGVDSPRLSSQLVIAKALGLDRLKLFMDLDRPLQEAELAAIRPLLARRGAGEPVAYVLGEKEFYGLDFRVTPDVLIPRPETEMLVEEAVRRLDGTGEGGGPRLADFGAGSGILAVTTATLLPSALVVAVDVSPGALAVARGNAERHGVSERVAFVRADFGQAPLRGGAFDLVLSNPPYVSEPELAQASPEVSRFEPRLALTAGPEGLDCLGPVVAEAGRVLRPGGTLLMEIGCAQGDRALALFEAGPAGWDSAVVRQDLAGLDRMVVAVKAG